MAISIPIVTEFDGKGIAKAKAEFAQLEGVGAKAQYAIKKAAIPAAAALAGVGAALADATKGAIEDAAAQDKLANNLRRTTNATDAQIAANEDWIATQGRLLGVTDDELRPVLAKLARATGSVTKAQQYATQAMDIATATSKPLATVTDAITKAMGGNMTALAKLAPEYRQLIKDGADFETVMSLIADTTGGAASQAAETTAGKFKRMKVAMDETKESIGAALIPVIETALPLLQKMADWAQKNPQAFTAVAAAIAAIATSIVAVNIAMALNPFTLIAAGIAAVGVAAVYAYNKFETFRKGVNFIINNVIASINAVIRGLNLLPKVNIPTIPQIGAGGGGSVPTLSGADMSRFNVAPTMATSQSVNSPVTINVNGGDPQQVVNALRKYMQVNGSVPIRVAS